MTTRLLRAGTLLALILGGSSLIIGGARVLLAQSTRVGGRDVPVTPFEQWFKRIGFLNTNAGCDAALQFDSLNTVQLTDCTDAANLRDLRVRGISIMGMPTTQGAGNSDAYFTKTVTGIADAAATNILTVTVPNAAHWASIPIVLMGTLGAGGAIGLGECTATAYGQVVLTRTPGVATVATATTLADTGSACVAGATAITLAYNVTAMTGAVGVTQTFNVQATITKTAGSSANHIVVMQADLVNANANGITVQ